MADCIGCGYCCWKAPCSYGHTVYGPGGPCGGLVYRDGRHWCAALEKDPMLYIGLAIGAGCCSSLNTWRREPIVDRTSGEVS
jgi:hypothetical protein